MIGIEMKQGSGRAFAIAAAVLSTILGSSGALAQNCVTTPFLNQNPLTPAAAGLAGADVIAGAISAANTAFLSQSTTFTGAPSNPESNSEGGGIWTRAVGGTLNLKTAQTGTVQLSVPVLGAFSGPGTCSTSFHETFGGFQVGQDVAKLNVNGWNVHVGTTAGLIESQGNLPNGNLIGGSFNSSMEAPYVGAYAAATSGGFFVDGMIRFNYYQTSLNSPSLNLFNQNVDAHGVSLNASIGYRWDIPNSSWFLEPSAGVVWSSTKVDPMNSSSPPLFGIPFNGTTQIDDLESLIGRVGLRAGTTVITSTLILQPFASVSVWKDFDGDYTANYTSCPGCLPLGITYTATASTQNIGTFGQYSIGISGQIINTGWLGFARVDYRNGDRMDGWNTVGGVRYQYTPANVAAVKMPVKARPVAVRVIWTGWYAGAIGGADYGRSAMEFPGISSADLRPAGVLAGGTLGYNQQVGSWVYGLEADLAWTHAVASSQCAPLSADAIGLASVSLFQMTCHDRMDWFATAAGRVGYATDRTLYYVKAGAAWTQETFSGTCNLGPTNGNQPPQNCANSANVFSNGFSVSDTRIGWMAGFGTEFALTAVWSAKAEFDWLDFGTQSLTLSDGTSINATQRIAQGKVGLNYKFLP
jgi:opacity protein-like surface antigen